MEWLSDFGLFETVISIVGAALAAVIGRGATAIKTKTGLDVEKQDREALHSAIMTGVRVALSEGPNVALDRVKEVAVHHAKTSVPDAIARLIPGEGVLERLALRYYREMVKDW